MWNPSGNSSISLPSERKPAASALMRSLSFTRSSAAPRHVQLAAECRKCRERRQLVDHARYFRRRQHQRAQFVVTDPDAASELALDHAFGRDLDIRAGTAKDVEERYPGAIQSEILDFDLASPAGPPRPRPRTWRTRDRPVR